MSASLHIATPPAPGAWLPPDDGIVVRPTPHPADELFAAVEAVQTFFRAQLAGPAGAATRQHLLEKRRVPAWLIDEAGLGYFPSGAYLVRDWVKQQGLSLEACADAGLIQRSKNGAFRAFERAHGRAPTSTEELSAFWLSAGLAEQPRNYFDYPLVKPPRPETAPDGARDPQPLWGDFLTIPIRVRDAAGAVRIAGFQYRSMRPVQEIGEKLPRYRSPLNTSILHWDGTMVGLAEEAEAMTASGEVIVCEGPFDRFAVKAAVRDWPVDQRPGVVCMNGANTRGADMRPTATALEKAGVLAYLPAPRVTLFFDGDAAGTAGMLKCGPLLSALGHHVAIARVADGVAASRTVMAPGSKDPKDPGELLERGGMASVTAALTASRSRGLATFAAEQVEAELQALPHQGRLWHRLGALDRLLPVLEALPPAVLTRAVRRVATAVALDESVVYLALAERGVTPPAPTPRPGRSAARARAT